MTKQISIIAILAVLLIGGLLIFSGGNKDVQKDTEVVSIDNTSEKNIQDVVVKDVEQTRKFDKAPDFTLSDWDGNKISLADFEGQSLIINSWAVWCPFCLDELIDFAELQEEVGDSVVIIVIDRAESTAKQKKFTDELGVTGRLLFLNDPDDSFYQSIGGFSMPETIFVDGEGNIRLHRRGPMDISEMRRILKDII